jgi:alkanesulfonate monooxygenase SsuD/methylene tetrahydromethanopterin reductase-like flavin-dependent oxidoreductase (luciferase family)
MLNRDRELPERPFDPLPLARERPRPPGVVLDDEDLSRHVVTQCAVRVCAVRLALMIEGQEGVAWDDWVALAETCEANGVEALFRSDHYLSMSDEERPVLDAWATIAALAARTTKLQLGTLVSPGTFRHPSVLARNAATADEVSGGRVTVGLGAGWMEREHELRERKRTLDEACERAGRDPAALRRSVMAPCVIGTSEAEVRASSKRIGERFGRDADTVLERYGAYGAVGTIDRVTERLRETEALGYERVMLQHLVHDDLETVALIGRELVPAVA